MTPERLNQQERLESLLKDFEVNGRRLPYWAFELIKTLQTELGTATSEYLLKAQDYGVRLAKALRKLANEAAGFLSLSDIQRHGMTNSRILRDRIEEARGLLLKSEGADSSGDPNTPLRMYIALKMLRAWNSGTAGFDGDVVATVNGWIDGGMNGPVPFPKSPFFADWASKNGLSNINGNVGFLLRGELTTDAKEPKQ